MKNLITIFDLLLFSKLFSLFSNISVMKRFLFISMLIGTPMSHANTCPPGEVITNLNSTITGSVQAGGDVVDEWHYYSISPGQAGNLVFSSYSSTFRTDVYFTKNNCTGDQILNNITTSGSTAFTLNLVANDTVFIAIQERTSNATINYTFDLNFIPDNAAPTSNAGDNQNVTLGSSVTLDGSGSSDSDGTITSYLWSEGVTTLSTDVNFIKSDFTLGIHTITLTVTDNDGATHTDTVVITVNDVTLNNTPLVSILPAAISVPEGIASVGLQIDLDEAPSTGDLNITYTNSYDSSTGYLIIPQGSINSILTIDINISSMLEGTDFNITLTAATGVSGQNNGNISSSDYISTITIGAAVPDLSISKIGSADPVTINAGYDYTITVYNRGTAPATNISVTDTLPTGLAIDLSTSNSDSVDWNCTRIGDALTCLHDGNISVGETKTILLHATAPPTIGTITNSASISSDSDYDASNNNATETTRIVSGEYQEIDEANELCYADTTDLTYATNGTDCEKVGNFFYGDGCTATVLVQTDGNLTANLTDVNITKMMAVSNNKDLDDGSCTALKDGTSINCYGPSPFAPDWSPSYLEAYFIPDVGTMTEDTNLTITDINTHNKKPLNKIAIYATYNYDGVFHYGRVYDCSGLSEGGILIESTADAIDTPIDANNVASYNASNDTSSNGLKYIQTMVASLQRSLTGVHLDITTKEAVPYTFDGDQSLYSPFVIIPYLVDTDENGECGSNFELLYDTAGNELVIPIEAGEYSGTKTITVPNGVRSNARLQLIMVDPNLLSEEGQGCLATSSTSGNLEGIGQCGNSEGQYIAGYTVDAWDRCGLNNGAPCLSNHGGYSGGGNPTYPGYNPIYDNVLGCYMCTFDIQPACSSDNFAIRPEKFDIGMSDIDAPNLLRAGKEYGVSLTARDALNNIPAGYTVTDHNFNNDLDTNTTRYFKDGAEDTNGLLHGTSDLNRSTTAYMVAGLSSLSTIQPASAQEITQASYDDVGLIGLKIYDKNWAAVDNDDTPMDCNSSEHTYICGELNVTFIPHHFGFAELNITNHAGPDSNFTYIADNRGMPSTTLPTRSPMAARVHTRIESRNKQDAITQNFREDFGGNLYYENNITVMQNVKIPTVRNLPAEPNAYVFGFDANESKIDDKLIGFGRTGGAETDAPGTRNVKWNESTYPLEFNFHREFNKPANPFDVNGTYYSISATSDYIDPDDGDTAIIDGSRVGDDNASLSPCIAPPEGSCVNANADNNATFYYGRARPSQYFYDDVTVSSVNTPIFIDVYCNLGFTACGAFGIDTVNGQINDADWWLSWEHSRSRSDGNITLSTSANGSVSAPPKPNIDASEGADKTVAVTHTSTTLPDIVNIDFVTDELATDYTNAWLIYNQDHAILPPSPFYKVRFIGQSGWAGHGDTGHVVDSNVSTKKNNRMGW